MTWTSVKEKLPKESGDYIVCDAYQQQYICTFDRSFYAHEKGKMHFTIKCECEYAENDDFDYDKITHWMPLPPCP